MISSFSDGADGSPPALPGARPPSPLPKRTWSELPGHGPHPGGRAVRAERARRTGWAWPSAAGTAGPWAVGLRGRPSGVGLLSAGPQGRAVSCSPLHRRPRGTAPHCTSAFPSVRRVPVLLRPPRVPLSLAVIHRAQPLGLALGPGVRDERLRWPGPQDVAPSRPHSGLPNLESGPATHFPKPCCDCYFLILASVTPTPDTFQNVAFSQATPSRPPPLRPGR